MPNIPLEALGFIREVEKEEKTNDTLKIDSLPPSVVINLKNNLDNSDFKINGQTIFSYENDNTSSVTNLKELVSYSLDNLLGYPSLSIENPSEVNGENSSNLKDTSFGSYENKSTLFTNSIANLNLVAALQYDTLKDPFNPVEGSEYYLTDKINNSETRIMDIKGELGTAFR